MPYMYATLIGIGFYAVAMFLVWCMCAAAARYDEALEAAHRAKEREAAFSKRKAA